MGDSPFMDPDAQRRLEDLLGSSKDGASVASTFVMPGLGDRAEIQAALAIFSAVGIPPAGVIPQAMWEAKALKLIDDLHAKCADDPATAFRAENVFRRVLGLAEGKAREEAAARQAAIEAAAAAVEADRRRRAAEAAAREQEFAATRVRMIHGGAVRVAGTILVVGLVHGCAWASSRRAGGGSTWTYTLGAGLAAWLVLGYAGNLISPEMLEALSRGASGARSVRQGLPWKGEC